MDDQNNLISQEQPNGNQIEMLAPRLPFMTLDMMPREPHLLDYLMILREASVADPLFPAGHRHHCDHRHLSDAACL